MMGLLIRVERKVNPKFEEAYQRYSMQGEHVPNEIKFPLIAAKMDGALATGFILDNFPATAEDIQYLERYLESKPLQVQSVISLQISDEEMKKRFEFAREQRGRADDTIENVKERREIQDRDREAVLDHYRNLELLHEINGEGTVENVHNEIMAAIRSGKERM